MLNNHKAPHITTFLTIDASAGIQPATANCEVTKAAIEEAMSRKEYPEGELYSSAAELFKALDVE